MKFNHILLSILLGSSIFLISTLLYAPSELRQLNNYSQSLENNNITLRERGTELENVYYQLRDNPESIIAEAYRIGFIFSDNSMIQVHPRERRVEALSAGEHVRIVDGNFQYEIFLRNISIIISLLIIFIQLALLIKKVPRCVQKDSEHSTADDSPRVSHVDY